MKRCNRLICILLSFALMLGMFVSVSAAEETDAADYSKEIEILEKLNVIKGYKEGNFVQDERITRAELAMLSICAMGMDNMSVSSNINYYDVPLNYWAVDYINAISRSGIMVGHGGYFDPDGLVDINQASKVMVEMLGYSHKANDKGGYPSGYLVVANDLDLFDGIDISGDFTRGEAAKLILNTLEADALELKSIKNEEGIYVNTGRSLMELRLGIIKGTGTVESNHISSIEGNPTCGYGKIIVEGQQYTISDMSYTGFLGREIDYYYNEDNNGDKVILYAESNSYNSDVYEVLSKDIHKDDISFGINTFVFSNEKGKIQKEKISNAVVIINGKVSSEPITKNDLAPVDGKVTLIDDFNDGSIDVVIVEDWRTAIVAVANSETGQIIDKLGGAIISTDSAQVDVIKDGKLVILGALNEDDVLLVARSRDGEYIKINASSQKASGFVSRYETNKSVIVGENAYKFNPVFDTSTLVLGQNMTFLLDSFGRIVSGNTGLLEKGGYAYLFDAEESDGLVKAVRMKVMTADGKISVKNSTAKPKYNEEGNMTPAQVMALLEPTGDKADTLIAYKENAEGLITHIYAPEDDSDYISADYPESKRTYSTANKVFGLYEKAGFYVDDTAPIFYVVDGNEDESKMITTADLADKTEYTVSGYGAGETMTPKAMVVRIPEGEAGDVIVNWATTVGVITNITQGLGDDGHEVTVLHIMTDGQELEFVVTENVNTRRILFPARRQQAVPFSEFKRGDLVFYSTNYKGQIDGLCRSIPYNADGTIETETEWCNEHGFSNGKIYGTANRTYGNLLEVAVGGDKYLFTVGSILVTVVDVGNDEIYPGSVDDIIPREFSPDDYSKIFINAGGGTPTAIVVYKNWK